MDHYPSWKLHKNPFWRVKQPLGAKQQQQQQPPMGPYGNLQDPNYQQQQQQQQSMMNSGMQDPNYYQQQQQQPQIPEQQFVPPSSMYGPPELVSEGLRQSVVAYEASQDVAGVIRLRIPPGKKMEHLGIKVQFIGRIDMVRILPIYILITIFICLLQDQL